jgi:uncharacterized membrane protein YfcA
MAASRVNSPPESSPDANGDGPSADAGASHRSQRRRAWPWLAFLGAFCLVWLGLVIAGDEWARLVEHWRIALAMAVGSYVAGSTPLGGGTIGFPVLVLMLDEPATIGRDFSFAVQSIGMVSASILILAMRRPLEWPMLRWGLLGATVGTPLGSLLLAPHVNDLAIKLLFAVVWCSFGIMHFVKLKEITGEHGITPATDRFDALMGGAVGLIGGATVAAVTGVGVDMLLYTVLVLVARADLRIAIPTSVILMAYTSVVGIATRMAMGGIEPEVYGSWLAAAPIVAVGAPLGALAVGLLPRMFTLVFVSLLCVAQFIWTCVDERLTGWPLVIALAGVAAFNAMFHVMYRWGRYRTTHIARGAHVPEGTEAVVEQADQA